jgi:hypothetical protein
MSSVNPKSVTIMGFTANLFTDQPREQLIAKGWRDEDLKEVDKQLKPHGLSIGMSVVGDPKHTFKEVTDSRRCHECGRGRGDEIHIVEQDQSASNAQDGGEVDNGTVDANAREAVESVPVAPKRTRKPREGAQADIAED